MAKKDSINKIEQEIEKSGTFNPLMVALQENDKKNLFKTNVTTAFMKTGFPIFDYYFGGVVNIHDEYGKLIKQEGRLGQKIGTFNEIIGKSGSGKSTLAVQIAGNIIRQYPFANVIHYDTENRMDISRIETITKLPASYFQAPENNIPRYMVKGGAVALDEIQEMIIQLWASKMKFRDRLSITLPYRDEFNQPITILQPTVIIIDSLAVVMNTTFNPESNKDVSEAVKIRGNTEGARDAKTFKGFFKDIMAPCKEANIIIYGINHINSNMSMNSFIPVAKQQNYLKQDESIPGGQMMLYLPENIIKLTAKPSDDFETDSDGFAGHMVMVEPIKSSSNQSGNNSKGISFELVFSHQEGFDSLRSLIIYGKENGIIEGNKNRLKFKNEDFTFSFKDIHKEVKEKPIWDCVKKYIYPSLDTHLPYVEIENIEFDNQSLDY